MTITWGPRTSARHICRYFATQIKGRNIIITGVSVGGLGFATAQAIAGATPGLQIITGRNKEKLKGAQRELVAEYPDLAIKLLLLDLGSLEATRKAAEEVLSWDITIDVLINNAGMTNYLAPWLFTNLLLPLISSSTLRRVVNLSSVAHLGDPIRWHDPNFTTGEFERNAAYGQSKTAAILHARALSTRGVSAFSVHPGGIYTPLLQAMPLDERLKLGEMHGVFHSDGSVNPDCPVWKTLDQGAAT